MAYTSATQATQGVIDNLTFAYSANTNKLFTVTESATDPTLKAKGFNPGSNSSGYTYDASGNLTSDSYKGISSIAYNHLNLPGQVNFSNGAKIVFTYAANGIKLRKQVYSNATTITSTTDYLDGIEYINNKPEAIYHPEGRAYNTTPAGATPTWRYEYNIKDHLGNNRISFSDLNGNGSISNNEILQEQHYYPFGMVQEGAWMNNAASDDTRYTYNGKEFNGEVGWYDYGARWYDPGVGRWTTVDPMSEKRNWLSPYNYVQNNPILRTDPTGAIDGIGDPVKPSVAGILLEGAYQAVSGGFNYIMRGAEALGFGEAGRSTRASVRYSEGGGVEGIDIVNGPSQGFVAEVKSAIGDAIALTPLRGGAAILAAETGVKNEAVNVLKSEASITTPYVRPSNATTPAQRASVQGKPCTTCGASGGKMVADHKKELVKEYYETGGIDKTRMKSVDAVQPQCPTCSAKQGAEMSKYSREQKQKLNGINN